MGTSGREKQDGSGITHDARLNVDAASSLSVTISGPFSQAVADRIFVHATNMRIIETKWQAARAPEFRFSARPSLLLPSPLQSAAAWSPRMRRSGPSRSRNHRAGASRLCCSDAGESEF